MKPNNYGLPDEISLQAIYDKVAVHLLIQGKPSVEIVDGENSCLYRNQEGCACAIGCLINDEDYKPSIEHSSADYLIDRTIFGLKDDSGTPVLFPKEFAEDNFRNLIVDLQTLHDNAPTLEDGKFDRVKLGNLLARLARNHKLRANKMWDHAMGQSEAISDII